MYKIFQSLEKINKLLVTEKHETLLSHRDHMMLCIILKSC